MVLQRARTSEADRRLARAVAEGGPDSLREAYERYGGAVFAFLKSTLRERHAAEDVLQQVFLDVWRAADTYDPERAGLLTWIMSIARNRAIDHQRKRVPLPSGDLLTEGEGGIEIDSAEALAERWSVAGFLSKLHPQEREVLRLRFYEDLSQTEIASRMDMPLGTVKMRMAGGLSRLREMMVEA